jgi:DHA2 family multidrug resistance protein
MAGGHSPWLIAVVISIATFMEVLDTSIANVSLSHIAGSLAAGPDESTWVLTSYLVSNAIVLPISGWLANVFGRKRFYLTCVALFTLSSFLCGIATTLPQLIFFRVLQGIGGGGLAPSEQSMLADSFTPRQRGLAFSLYGIAVVVAPAIGPTLGGWITDNYSWHWIFFINVPVGILSLFLSSALLVEPPIEAIERKKLARRGFSVDYVGFALIALGLGCLQVVLDKGQRDDWWQSDFIRAFSVISAVSLVALVLWELRHKHPIVNLRLFRLPSFASSCVLMFALGFLLFATTQMIPQFVQTLYGYNATTSGLVISPGGLLTMAMMPVVGFLSSRVQPRVLIGIGMLVEILACWHIGNMTLDASYSDFVIARMYQAVGLPFIFIPISTVSYAGIPPDQTNEVSAFTNLMRNLGGSVGISLAQTWIAQRSQVHQAHLVGHVTATNPPYRQAMGALVGLLGDASHATARIGQIVERQATFLAYLDSFRYLAGCALLSFPLVFLLRKVKPGAQSAAH